MQNFDYVAAKTVDEVFSVLAQSGRTVRVLSGGTDLIVQLREGRKNADVVVDVKLIPELNELVIEPGKGLTIGASVSCKKICSDPAVVSLYPGLVDGFSIIGGTQIQGRASVGGNLCNASPAADSTPGLIVHRAVCLIAGPEGTRELPVEEFCVAPGRNALAPEEFLVAVRVPPPAARWGASYMRFIPRNEMDIAVVGTAAAVQLSEDGNTFETARVALGAVAPTPLLVREAGDFLAGKPASAETIFEAARIAQAAARPISDMRGTADQRRHLTMVLARRVLQTAVDRARGRQGGNGHVSGNGHNNGGKQS